MKIHHLFVVLLLCLSSCRYKDSTVNFHPTTPKFRFAEQYNRDIDIKVIDNRQDKEFIGFKNPVTIWKLNEESKNSRDFLGSKDGYNFKVAELTSTQDLADIVLKKFAHNMPAKGLEVRRFAPNQLKVEIEEVGFVGAMYRNFIYNKLKITMRTRAGKIEKIYNSQITSYRPMPNVIFFGPFDPGMSADYYNDVVNEAIDDNIEYILKDSALWNLVS